LYAAFFYFCNSSILIKAIMRSIAFREALREAMSEEMRREE
jgi:hypothetical protein